MSETPNPIEEETQPEEKETEVTKSTVEEQPTSQSDSDSLNEEQVDDSETPKTSEPMKEEIQSEETESEVAESTTEEQPAPQPNSEQLSENQVDELENVEFPDASFDMLLMQHHTQAMLAMGMIPDPATGQVIKNKSAAKFHIDMLGIIQERTKGNLNQGEEEALNGVLHNLRMMFVEVNK